MLGFVFFFCCQTLIKHCQSFIVLCTAWLPTSCAMRMTLSFHDTCLYYLIRYECVSKCDFQVVSIVYRAVHMNVGVNQCPLSTKAKALVVPVIEKLILITGRDLSRISFHVQPSSGWKRTSSHAVVLLLFRACSSLVLPEQVQNLPEQI